MGAALATLNAVDIVVNGYNKPMDTSREAFLVTAFVFASPRVGNSSFKNTFSSLGDNIRVLRIENANDLVPHLPLKLQMMCFPMNIGYSHIGKVLRIDTSKSPYLKQPGDIQRWHDMETYLHGVAGTQGEGEFDLVVPHVRAIALVNKYSDGLIDDCHVPANWWVEKNKGMVRCDNGSWLLMDHEEVDGNDGNGGHRGGGSGDGDNDDDCNEHNDNGNGNGNGNGNDEHEIVVDVGTSN
ncbi:putative fungal lipase-like domain, alpha/Beta hydrolase, phospholipase A1-II [Helianthus annuus]|nr:putative fungal lipase-like domain, alpha/Beta hydrolase, phospholipase A1-II [Helianthus annuus]